MRTVLTYSVRNVKLDPMSTAKRVGLTILPPVHDTEPVPAIDAPRPPATAEELREQLRLLLVDYEELRQAFRRLEERAKVIESVLGLY